MRIVNNLPEEYAIYHEGKKPTWADVGGTSFFTTDGTNIASTKPLYEQGNRVYSAANKPAATDIGAEPTLEADRKRKITYGTAEPTGGSDGDIYIQYEV